MALGRGFIVSPDLGTDFYAFGASPIDLCALLQSIFYLAHEISESPDEGTFFGKKTGGNIADVCNTPPVHTMT